MVSYQKQTYIMVQLVMGNNPNKNTLHLIVCKNTQPKYPIRCTYHSMYYCEKYEERLSILVWMVNTIILLSFLQFVHIQCMYVYRHWITSYQFKSVMSLITFHGYSCALHFYVSKINLCSYYHTIKNFGGRKFWQI